MEAFVRNIGFVLLLVSVVLGAFVVFGLRHLSAARGAPDGAVPRTTVVVASRPIGFGEPITAEQLRLQPWPQGAAPQGAFSTISQVTSQKRVALGPIGPNEPLLASRISGPGGRATLSGVIREGMRATTIRVNDVFGVAGFVLPGDFVDVLVTREEASAAGERGDVRTDVLLRGIRVLAVDQVASEDKNEPVVAKAATIEVTSEQAQKIALASQVGTLSLALRGTADPLASDQEGAPATVRTSDLRLQGAPPPPVRPVVVRARRPQRAAPAAPTIQIIRGVEASVSRVPALG
jgi:pilus assembly protein CpaB